MVARESTGGVVLLVVSVGFDAGGVVLLVVVTGALRTGDIPTNGGS